jgi:polyisoprenyl-phosphate glycosyltransferase
MHLEKINNSSQPVISVVVPCYNEEDVLIQTLNELEEFALSLPIYTFEFIFVDDGSQDGTLDILRNAAMQHPLYRVLSFSRNFGHQIAVTAGIDAAIGDAVALIDADLQDPPEVLSEMIHHWEEGVEVVYAVRASREGESAFKISTARWFYRVLNRLSETPIPLDTGDFRLMDRKVVDVLKQMPERHRFVRGLVAWIGYRQVALPYHRKKRAAGTSKYPFRKMLRFATDGILSFSSKPLQIATNMGLFAGFLAMLGIIYALVLRVMTDTWVEGWTAIMIAVLFLGGVQLISLGIIGEYIGRIYEESKRRPLYIISERAGFDDNTDVVGTEKITHERS